jgi:hypothetical protein
MIPAHADLIARLTTDQATRLYRQLLDHELLPPQDEDPDPHTLSAACVSANLSHAEVVLSCASLADEDGVALVSALLERPMYRCARGETSSTITDIRGRPLATPICHRIGEAPQMPPTPPRMRRARPPRSDPRVIIELKPNPKLPTSASYGRYKLYAIGMTVDQYVAAGGRMADVHYDAARGFITLQLP